MVKKPQFEMMKNIDFSQYDTAKSKYDTKSITKLKVAITQSKEDRPWSKTTVHGNAKYALKMIRQDWKLKDEK